MLSDSLGNPFAVIRQVEILASVSVALVSMEILAQPQIFSNQGVMTWEITSLRRPIYLRAPLSHLLGLFLAYPRTRVFQSSRLICVVVFALLPSELHEVKAALAGCVAVGLIGMFIRSPLGLDGADQVLQFVFVGLTLTYALPIPVVGAMFLAFVTAQACLAYTIAGIAKATSADWWSGQSLIDVLATCNYGNPKTASRLRKQPALAAIASCSLIVWECTFPLVLVIPQPARLSILAIGVVFHATNARVMGMNTFFWSFVALYPAVMYCGEHVSRIVSSA